MKSKVLITGSSGFVGTNLYQFLIKKKKFKYQILAPNKKVLNLMNFNNLENYFKKNKPEIVVHLAAINGGVHSNVKYPADFYFKNSTINNNIFEVCAKYKTKKLVCISAGAAYPKNAKIPLNENDFWRDLPGNSHLGYGASKRNLSIQSQIYNYQHKLKSAILIPPNIYGPFDNVDKFKSSVTASLITKFIKAKEKKENIIEVWGDPNTQREFLYVEDFAKIIIEAFEKKKIQGTFNIGKGKSISIGNLVSLIGKKINFTGDYFWNKKKPSGHKVIKFNVKKFKKNFLFNKFTNLDKGLEQTIKEFTERKTTRG